MAFNVAHTNPCGEVLVVDDTPESLAYLSELLGEQGYVVRAAPNGELAIWSASTHPPDLILLDVRMPGMDGFEACRQLKQDPRTAAVPVIFLSAQSDLDDKIHGFHAGGVDFVGKPFASEEVLQRVATHIKLAQVSHELAREKAMLEVRVYERTAELEKTAVALREEIIAHHQAEERLRLAASAFQASLSSMYIADSDGLLLDVNPAFTQTTGYDREECLGEHVDFLQADKNEPARLAAFWESARDTGSCSGELWYRRKDGNAFPCLHTIVGLYDVAGKLTHYVGVLLDLSESKDAQTLIEFLSHHDPLTGLPNRILVRDRFAQMVRQEDSQELIAVVCINLDRFRHINDFHGYAIGNEVLQWVAGQLVEGLPSKDTIFRESADEFVLVHRDTGGMLGVRMLIETLLSQLDVELDLDGLHIALSVSLGVAVYPSDGDSLEELLANASLAMARIKNEGGGSYAFFSEKLDQGVRVRFELAQRLRHALSRQEFQVHYQPQYTADTGRLVAAEALLRWYSPEFGFVSPVKFIPIAEETGCIVDIGTWVLRQACLQIAEWERNGLGYVKVAVNLSAHQFMHPDVCATVAATLAESGIPPAYLELEITEGTLIDDVQQAIATMHELKGLGVTISLDDFGTGYSSLSYLKKFPIDYLKIDQSFVRDLMTEPDADAIVLSIIGLAHNMRLQVIAEGVETQEQRGFLAAHHCDLLQGYLFSKPVPEVDFARLLTAQVISATTV